MQFEILSTRKRYNVARCGRRVGKTELGKRDISTHALMGYPTAWISPTYKMLAPVWDTDEKTTKCLQTLLAPVTTRVDSQDHRLELKGGGSIEFYSMDRGAAEKIRGRKYRVIVLDECAQVAGFKRAWEADIEPTLLDYEGDAWFLSTPRDGSGFNQLYEYAASGIDPEWQSWLYTTYDNPHISDAAIERMRSRMSEATFAQEILAESSGIESELVYPSFRTQFHVKNHRQLGVPFLWGENEVARVVGIDPGGIDHTAIIPVGINTRNDHFHVFGMAYKPDVDLDYYIAELEKIERYGHIDGVAVGETGGATIINTLRTAGFNAFKPKMDRYEGIDVMRMLLEKQRLTIEPDCKDLIYEFSTYRKKFSKDTDTGERYATRTPVDHHADALDALRYAVMGYIRGDVLRNSMISQAKVNRTTITQKQKRVQLPKVLQKRFKGARIT